MIVHSAGGSVELDPSGIPPGRLSAVLPWFIAQTRAYAAVYGPCWASRPCLVSLLQAELRELVAKEVRHVV